MFAMTGALLATSCSNDELDAVQSGNEAQVTFSLGVEGGIGVKTRAISDGTGADKLVYAVFDEDGNRISSITKVERTNVTFPATETLTLAKGQTYKVAFWAQDADCSAYTLDDNMNVTVDYANAANNDETRDAFFKTETFTVTGTASIDVVLKRPFAQINVGVTTEDWKAAVASGITIDQSKVVVKNAATSLNLVTGAVSNPIDVTYNFATIPAEELKVDTDKDGNISNSETYNWLSMSYILVNDGSVDGAQKTTLEGLEFTFKPESGNDITLKDGLTSVPVQRNWRTNILGKLLTGDITFNISIDPIYDGDYIYPDGSAQELIMAAANGGKVELSEDVALDQMITVAKGATMVLDLNGHTITNNTTGVAIRVNGSLIINGNGKVDGGHGGNNQAINVPASGNLTINGGEFTVGPDANNQGNSCIETNNGQVTINGGTFSSEAAYNGKYYVLNVTQTQGGTGFITVTGGTFINYNPATGDDALGGSFVAKGYSVVEQTTDGTTTYTVVKGVAVTSAQNFDQAIQEAIDNGSNTIYAASTLTLSSNVDGQGVTIEGPSSITLSDNAQISNMTFANNPSGVAVDVAGSGITLEKVTVDAAVLKGVNVGKNATVTIKESNFNNRGYGVYSNGGSTTIEDCTFDKNLTYAYNGSGSLIAKKCNFNGWMSGWSLSGEFEECTFNYGDKWYPAAVCYGTTTFTNCTFGKHGYPLLDQSGNISQNKISGTTYGYDYSVSCGAKDITITFTNCHYSDGTSFNTDVFKRQLGDGKQDPASVTIDGITYTDMEIFQINKE